jgi:hypothetical protein
MKAFIIDRYKPRDGGRIADVPEPVPADGQVLVAPFASTNDAIAYVEPGRAKGKIVVTTR